ncbi:hypothetical protein LCGC14_1000110 [marine sediment metagenome]|uniref:Phage capsid-like C-terminal domain-containing protein n=1 Tax=marine sediment metagenome TaxID=412755 RepID=A0A0F9QLQ6_9ZZZZ
MSTPLHSQTELMEKRANVIEQARELLNRAKGEDRDLHADEKEQYERMMEDVASLKERADREFQIGKIEAEIASETREAPKTEQRKSDLLYTVSATAVDPFGSTEYRSAFNTFLRTNDRTEIRALEQGVTSEGGALVPTPLSDQIYGIAAQGMSIYGLATKVQTDSGNFDLARVATSGTAYAGSNEETNLSSLGADPAFGTYALSCNNRKASHYVVVSTELLQDSKFGLEDFIAQHGGNAMAEVDEMEYVNGGGTNGPTGFLSDATVAFTTSAAFTYANLMSLKYGVRQGWRRKGTWVMNDASLSQVLVLTDSASHLIFRPSPVAGGDDNLIGSPVRTSFAMANDASGGKPVAFGDWSNYVIVEKPLTISRSDHVLFATDQTAFRLTRRRDGRLAQDGAVKVISRTS